LTIWSSTTTRWRPCGHPLEPRRHTLIGANGAGKSTTLRAISGLTRPSGGAIWFDGRRIDGLAAEKVVALGIAQVPEGRRVFPDLTVIENLLIGAFLRKDKDGIARDRDEVFGHFPRLAERRKQLAKTLSGGERMPPWPALMSSLGYCCSTSRRSACRR
jgi:ABC-type branched-subunit amino acid transport system ATPase component